MTSPDSAPGPRRLIPWQRRASYLPGTTRRQRKIQRQRQVYALVAVLLVAGTTGGLFALANYQNAGSTQTVSCADFPQYCVPLAGGGAAYPDLEAPGARRLDAASEGAAGVVRGVAPELMPRLGDPDAPVQFTVIMAYPCGHCAAYHVGDLHRFIRDDVLTGRASLQFGLSNGTGGQYTQRANQATLCAGEQGAAWEVSDEFFRQSQAMSYRTAFTLPRIRQTVENMGLDGAALERCVLENRYLDVLLEQRAFAAAQGMTHTPTVWVRYGTDGPWMRVEDRSYDGLRALVEAAPPG